MPTSLASIGTSASSNSASTLAVAGIATGFNWQNTVTQLANAERSPEIRWQNQQTSIAAKNASYGTIANDLTTLQTDAASLKDPAFFNSRITASSVSTVASASAASGATLGNFSFNISQLATSAQMIGSTGISQVLSPTGNPSAVTIGTAGFSSPITAGTFTINGGQVSLATTDSLQQVFNKISAATGNNVTASYDPTADKITLSTNDASPLVMGSSTDTSNFLQVAQLYNNNSSLVSSASALGHVNTSIGMVQSDLLTPVTDGGSGHGAFTINGVTINYSATNNSIQNVLDSINNSAAGVTAAYDSVNNRFTLANNTTGDTGIAMQDVTGNFLAATGLAGGTLNHGKNLNYTLNGNPQVLVSQSNTISSTSSGITGLSVTALTTGTTTIGVSADTATISNTIQKLVTDYNTTQSFIASQMKVSTDASGKVTPGTLTADPYATNIATQLRAMMTHITNIAGTSGAIKSLTDMGFKSNGKDNTLALSDTSVLTAALTNSLTDIKSFFTDTASGLGSLMNKYVTDTTGTGGTLTAHTDSLTQQSANISTQISNLENKIATDAAFWTQEFQAMETATAKTNQQLTYLNQSISNGSL